MAAIPKLNIKKIPIPKAISHKISKVIRVLNGIGFHPPKVLIRKWIKPMMGMPMTKIPEMDNKVAFDRTVTDSRSFAYFSPQEK